MIGRIKAFLHGRVATSAGQGMAGAATVHVCVHPCPEHLALAAFFWIAGIAVAIKARLS
jgi:hypothetical protein